MGTLKEINFYNDNIDLENFKSKLAENHTKTLVFTILDILQLKKLIILKILTVWILCIYVLPMQTDILKK